MGRRSGHPVNQTPLLTREFENPETEDAGCGRNPAGFCTVPGLSVSEPENAGWYGECAKCFVDSRI